MHARAFVALLLIALTLPSCCTAALWNGGLKRPTPLAFAATAPAVTTARAFRADGPPGRLLLHLSPAARLSMIDEFDDFPLDAQWIAVALPDEPARELLAEASTDGPPHRIAIFGASAAGNAMLLCERGYVACEFELLQAARVPFDDVLGDVTIAHSTTFGEPSVAAKIAFTPVTVALDAVTLPVQLAVGAIMLAGLGLSAANRL